MITIGSLFTGYGGLDMAVEAATGGCTIWRSDIDPGACKIISHHWPADPNLGDITEIDWKGVDPVHVLTGGFPCQDVSAAGRRAGLRPGTRSGLWQQMARAIDILRPGLVVAENVRGLLSADAHSDVEPCPWCVGDPGDEPPLRALGAVLGDLADIGYDAAWHGLTAASVGAPHGRFRVFIVAWPTDADGARCEGNGTITDHQSEVSDDGRNRSLAPDTESAGGRRRRAGRQQSGEDGRRRSDLGRCNIAADATSDGWHEGRPEPARLLRRPDAAECGNAAAYPDRDGLAWVGREFTGERDFDRCCGPLRNGHQGESTAPTADAGRVNLREQPVSESRRCGTPVTGDAVSWGQFEPAIRRWERLTRPAPTPTEASSRGTQRLSPRFVEWMMGLPSGHVTDVPGVTRNEQLKALGNGVVPQQAEAALLALLGAKAAA